MTKEELEKEIEELRKELQERGEDYDQAYHELNDCTTEAEYKERVTKHNKAWDAYDSAYNNYMRAWNLWYEKRGALKER